MAVSWLHETDHETGAQRAKTARNRFFPLCRYKYYNPAKWTKSVSYQFRYVRVGFVMVSSYLFHGFVCFFYGFVKFRYAIHFNRCRKSGFRTDV